MYGLADRISRGAHGDSAVAGDATLTPLFPRAGVLVLGPDTSLVTLLRTSLGSGWSIAAAVSAADAIGLLGTMRSGAIVIDLGTDPAEAESLAAHLVESGLDHLPLMTVDPDEPVNADALHARVRAALHVGSRVWFGGGLRSRMAA